MTRTDWANTWGDLGGATYDWGSTMHQQGVNVAIDQNTWLGTVDNLQGKYSVGGAMEAYYPPANKTTPSEFGAMSESLWNMVSQHVQNYGGISKQALINSWGDLGGAMYDYMQGIGAVDARGGVTMPDKASFAQNADYLAKTYAPGGSQGFIYKLAPTPQGQIDQANLAYLNQQIENAKAQGLISAATAAQIQASIANMPTAAQAQAQINQQLANLQAQGAVSTANAALINAQIANLPTQAQAQAQIQGQINLINQQIEALKTQGLIDQATADKIKAEIANMPTPEMAQAKYKAEINNLVSTGQLTQAQAGLATAQTAQIGAEMQANPRDWTKSWFYQQNMQPPVYGDEAREMPAPGALPGRTAPPVPPWLSAITENKALPAFSGQSDTLGTFPIKAPSPNQVSAKVFNAMAPSEVSGLEGLASSSGWFWPDFIKKMIASQQRQPGIGANPVLQWGGF